MTKKTLFTVVLILALLSSAVAGTQLVNVGRANPFSQSAYSGEMSAPASVTPPSITMHSPLNGTTCNENFVILAFDAVVGQAPYSLPSKRFNGLSLTEVYYEADWLENKTVVNGTSKFTYVYNSSSTAENPFDKLYGSTTGSYSCNLRLDDIPEGSHIIRIKATERGYYYYVVGGVSFEYYSYSKSAISLVKFTVDTVPIVSFLSFENRTFDVSDVPLNFTVNQAVSKIAYCLDGQGNVTISGNTTLTELPNGEHNITVYVTDDTGNTGSSETIIFNVDKPEPTAPFPTTMVIAPITSVAFVCAGLIVYLKKRKRMLMKRKVFASLLILWFAVSTLTAIGFVGLTKANGFVPPERLPLGQAYIRSNGDVEPPTLPIQRLGNVYALTNNITNYSIEIQKDNVIFDGNGYSLTFRPMGKEDNPWSEKTADPAIQIINKTDIIVKNVTFENYITGSFTGVRVENSSNIIIMNTTVKNELGVSIRSCTWCSYIGNEITNAEVGIGIFDSTFINLAYNEISKNRYIGATIGSVRHSNITRNNIMDNAESGIIIHGSNFNNCIFENNFINNEVGLLYRGNSTISANDNIFNNYWYNNQWNTQNTYDNGRSYVAVADHHPLTSPISTSFDPSLFPLPSLSTSTSEPFPITPVATSIASAVVVSLGALVYFRKRKH